MCCPVNTSVSCLSIQKDVFVDAKVRPCNLTNLASTSSISIIHETMDIWLPHQTGLLTAAQQPLHACSPPRPRPAPAPPPSLLQVPAVPVPPAGPAAPRADHADVQVQSTVLYLSPTISISSEICARLQTARPVARQNLLQVMIFYIIMTLLHAAINNQPCQLCSCL